MTAPNPQLSRAISKAVTQPASSALARREDMPTWLAETIEKYTSDAYELLLPAIPVNAEVHPWFRPAISIVRLSPDPDEGDVYKSGWKNNGPVFSLSKAGLEAIADGAGITFGRPKRLDDRSDHDYCEIAVEGSMRNSAGVIRSIEKMAHHRMSVVAENMWQQRVAANERSKTPDTPETMKKKHDGEVSQFRRFLVERTETRAMLRVIRALLGVKGSRTAAQIAKPKVVLRFDFVGDMSDPDVKRLMLERAAGATESMYGPTHRTREIPHEEADDETLDREEREEQEDDTTTTTRSGGPVEPEADLAATGDAPAGHPQTAMQMDESRDWLTEVSEGAKNVGLTHSERNRIVLENDGDLEKTAKLLHRFADDPAALKAWRGAS